MIVTITVQGGMNDGPGYEARLAALKKALIVAAAMHLANVVVGVIDYETDLNDDE